MNRPPCVPDRDPGGHQVVHVVDDEPAVHTLFAHIGRSHGLSIAAYRTAGEFLLAAPHAPGCVVLDLVLPDHSGIEILRELARQGDPMPVVFMSGRADVGTAVQALKLGSLDFLEKPFPVPDMVAAIRAALRADRQRRRDRRDIDHLRARFAGLTRREQQVLQLVVQGLPNRLIAARLGVSPKTVEVHRAHVMQKTAAASLADLVKLAVAVDHADPRLAAASLSSRSP